jgi:hypothetical protein
LYFTDDKGDQRIYNSFDGRESIEVNAVSLDDYFEKKTEITQVDFIKIDIQGAEPLAISGMKKLIRRNPQMILCIEFWPFGLEKCGYGSMPFLNLLKDCGLKYFDLNAGGYYDKLADDSVLLSTYIPSTKAFTNLICFQQR